MHSIKDAFNWYVRKKNIVITPQDEISLLLFYKKKKIKIPFNILANIPI